MDIDLIDNLHLFSTVSINVPLEKTSINRMIYIDNQHCLEEFLDPNSFFLQDELLNAKDNKIEIILKNLNTAIETNCNNEIDLTNLLSLDQFKYSFQTNLKEKSITKMYNVISKFPLDDVLFKKYWLKIFIKDCTKIVKNINTILNKEQLCKGESIINDLTTNKPYDILVTEDAKLTNPYQRIFTSDKAYEKFNNLLNEFERSKIDLANYSFVFHRMKKDGLIYIDLKQIEFIDFLSIFDINLNRLKPERQLGNNDLREGIYNRI